MFGFGRDKAYAPTIPRYCTSTGHNFDRECYDNIDCDIDTCVSWYIMSHFANKQGDQILSSTAHKYVGRKLLYNFHDIDHKYKNLIDQWDATHNEFNGEYPKNMEKKLNAFRQGFTNSGHKG